MIKQTIEILTSFDPPKSICMMGNVAVARGAIEAGVCGVFSYPGTPSTEISEVFNYVSDFQGKATNREKYPQQTEHTIYFEYSINEKVALEKAIAYSIGNKSAMCVMKNVGMNVASDALMSITYQTIIAPLVIIVCDDPGCFSSSNEQDSRYWGKFASVPVLNPSSPKEALTMTKDAFDLSGYLKMPVIVRMTTSVDHSRGIISYNSFHYKESIAHFDRLPQHINIPTRTAQAHKTLLNKLLPVESYDTVYHLDQNSLNINVFDPENPTNTSPHNGSGIITSGVADLYVRELLARNEQAAKIPVLKLGMIHPFPAEEVLDFMKQGLQKILILEELDPIIENDVRVIAQKNKITVEILGKGSFNLSVCGAYNLDIIRFALEAFTGQSLPRSGITPLKFSEEMTGHLPPRPPALCAGCPHRATFYALKLAVPRDNGEIIMCGDIGCIGLGALAPLQMIDTINHMGMSISMAQGLSEALQIPAGKGKVVTMLGDGTFFHSGVASLLNAIYTRANITLIIFDNRTIGMTGHQDHPGATRQQRYRQIDILTLVRGMGVEMAESMYPFDLKDTYHKVNKAIAYEGVSVLVSQASCIFLPEFKEGAPLRKQLQINPQKCNSCGNHSDASLSCSREKSSQSNLLRAKAKIAAEKQIPGWEQLCPANICNHGFFYSILGGNVKEALEIVRDKMLFARVCGNICHRPCESLYAVKKADGQQIKNLVPLKKLKKYVSSFDENFLDFSRQIHRAAICEKNHKKIAVIGAGPAGLSAAYDLIQEGYEVTVFEKESEPGGMIRFVIPDFRMNKEELMEEISVLDQMGVAFRFNTSLGKDFTLQQLSNEFDAVILAIGMWAAPVLDIVEKNIPAEKRFDAIDFLRKYNSGALKIEPGASILVIGGGNSAMDAARSAKKLDDSNNIVISCLEKFEKMPAFPEEIAGAILEGVDIMDNSYIDAISVGSGIEVQLNNFETKEKSAYHTFDYIITAIGQNGGSEITKIEGLALEQNNRLSGTPGFGNVFFAGDIAAGNHVSLIGAIGSGKKAAVQVRKLLEDYAFEYEGEAALQKLTASPEVSADTFEPAGRIQEEFTELDCYNLYQPCSKCDHCLDNFGCPALIKVNGKVVIDDVKCTRCGLCVDVCPNDAITWI
jgi:indolepyruvate ferredoxin oxidoreductase, alpha subunit